MIKSLLDASVSSAETASPFWERNSLPVNRRLGPSWRPFALLLCKYCRNNWIPPMANLIIQHQLLWAQMMLCMGIILSCCANTRMAWMFANTLKRWAETLGGSSEWRHHCYPGTLHFSVWTRGGFQMKFPAGFMPACSSIWISKSTMELQNVCASNVYTAGSMPKAWQYRNLIKCECMYERKDNSVVYRVYGLCLSGFPA